MMRTLAALIFIAPLLAGCVSPGFDDGTSSDPTLPEASPLADHLHDLSPVIPGSTVENSTVEHHLIEGPDGPRLDTWVVVPPSDGPVPLVMQITPYYGGGDPTIQEASPLDPMGRMATELISRGYAYGISSVRGTGNSEGCFSQGGVSEAHDSAAVIEFLAQEPWSNGAVGLIGASYPGTTPQDVWVEAPPALKTIVPVAGISDMYKYNFVNGVPIDVQGLGFNTYYWGIVGLGPAGLNGGAQPLDGQNVPGAVIGEICPEQVDVQYGGVSSTIDGNKDGYWMERDFLRELHEAPDRDRASVFYVHGLQDWNVKPHNMEDWLVALQGSGVPFKAMLGQWGHAFPQSSFGECNEGDACRNDWWNQTMIAWFDQFLKDVDTGILDAPAVQIQDDDRLWRHEHHWPPLDVRWDRYAMQDDALVRDGTGSGAVSYYDYNGDAVDHVADAGNNFVTDVPDTSEQGAQGPDHVLFRSDPFTANATIAGLPVFEANVTATGDRASLILTLAEERPDGTLRPFNFAAQSLNHVASLQHGDESIADETQQVRVRFFPQDDMVHEDHRLVLIAAGNTVGGPGPSLVPISDGSTITIDLDGAALHVPVRTDPVYESVQPFDGLDEDDG